MNEDLIREYLNKEETSQFLNWAWGNDFEKLSSIELCQLWNSKHYKDAFRISPGDKIEDSLYKMMLWWLTKVKK